MTAGQIGPAAVSDKQSIAREQIAFPIEADPAWGVDYLECDIAQIKGRITSHTDVRLGTISGIQCVNHDFCSGEFLEFSFTGCMIAMAISTTSKVSQPSEIPEKSHLKISVFRIDATPYWSRRQVYRAESLPASDSWLKFEIVSLFNVDISARFDVPFSNSSHFLLWLYHFTGKIANIFCTPSEWMKTQ
jgi:hypothetical protein